jgi:P-type Ca2+ transporter type 2C
MSDDNSNTQLNSGLTDAEISSRLKTYGYNELPQTQSKSVWVTAWGVVREPMFLLLIACGTLYLLLGDVQEALMLLGFVFVVLGITLYQERKTERALEALRDLSSPRALVIRDGQRKRIAGREVVIDDLIVLSEGDRVPADSAVLSSEGLTTDESLLTGESVPVRKVIWDNTQKMARPGGDDLPFVYSGTLVVQGQGVAKVLAIGSQTEMGGIGKALQSVESGGTKLQIEVGLLVRRIAIFAACLCTIIVIVYGITRGNWLQGFLAGITLAMAMLPEEFPVVLTIFLALGAWRLSKINVLARHVPVIETLGSATVLCVDKTGTLTENRMAVRALAIKGKIHQLKQVADKSVQSLPEELHEIIEFGILASQRDPYDPMEKAFHELGITYLSKTDHMHGDWELERGYALSPNLLAMSQVWRSPMGGAYVLATKGAPEAIADLCHLSVEQTKEMSEQVAVMAEEGLRVLGVARGNFENQGLPKEQHDFKFDFLGLVGLADPVRDTVPAAVKECYAAGIRIVMITGDHPTTAQSIARQAGIQPIDEIITGPELERFDDSELKRRVRTVNVFARMIPEQKLRLVNAFKANGEIVAMTGDGVNDAPALKSANIGIAMGGRGTDVAREAAALVLLDDDFASIVRSVRMGRRIYDHLQKAMTYIVAVHVPIAGMSIVPVLLGSPIALMPVHILFLELIIDPACSVVFEAEPDDDNVMTRPPRDPSLPMFGSRLIGLGVLQGMSSLLVVLAIYLAAFWGWLNAADAIALSFTTLVISNVSLILVNRSWTKAIWQTLMVPNAALWWVVGGASLFLGLALYVPFLQKIFHFSTLHFSDIGLCVAGGVMSIVWFEVLKLAGRSWIFQRTKPSELESSKNA